MKNFRKPTKGFGLPILMERGSVLWSSKRLDYFIRKTKENKLIGYGGIFRDSIQEIRGIVEFKEMTDKLNKTLKRIKYEIR